MDLDVKNVRYQITDPVRFSNKETSKSAPGTSYIRTTLLVALTIFSIGLNGRVLSQGGSSLFGDVRVDESKADGRKPLSLTVVLYTLGGNVAGRQTVASGGRYRFLNIRPGEYDIAVEIEANEIARVHISITGGSSAASDVRQDLEFEWKPASTDVKPKAGTVLAVDEYHRTSSHKAIFEKAQQAVDKKNFEEAVVLFQQLLQSDDQDFQAWTELGTAYLLENKRSDAEKAYLHAIQVRPGFALAQLNLGRLLAIQKRFADAIEPLSKAVELRPESAEANLLLGEAYLQNKKGSKAVGYLNEAAKLGKPEAHLRLATLYNAAGLKDLAATEYEQFLKKQPDYPDRKKLEQYISANKKPTN
jgi:cytochrome c-type biogenesis protein CcmH/NrfG